jgi:hypothetical protein
MWASKHGGGSVLSADDFYTSGTFWLTAVLVVLTVGAIVVAIVVARQGTPKRLLIYGIRTATPMVQGPAGVSADIEVRRRSDGYELANPYHVEVLLENRGRTPIAAGDFSNGRPACFHLNAPIKILYELRPHPPGRAWPDLNVVVDDDVVELRPGLIAKGQRILIPLVVEGTPTMTVDPLSLNADVVEASLYERRRRRRSGSIVLAAFATQIGVGFLALPDTGFQRIPSGFYFVPTVLVGAALGFYFGWRPPLGTDPIDDRG